MRSTQEKSIQEMARNIYLYYYFFLFFVFFELGNKKWERRERVNESREGRKKKTEW